MWVKWISIHESYGLPRVAQECRRYLESQGIQVRLISKQTKRSGYIYMLQVPQDQEEQAKAYLLEFKSSFQ